MLYKVYLNGDPDGINDQLNAWFSVYALDQRRPAIATDPTSGELYWEHKGERLKRIPAFFDNIEIRRVEIEHSMLQPAGTYHLPGPYRLDDAEGYVEVKAWGDGNLQMTDVEAPSLSSAQKLMDSILGGLITPFAEYKAVDSGSVVLQPETAENIKTKLLALNSDRLPFEGVLAITEEIANVLGMSLQP